jgi:large subunit ribosomal protein L25
MAEVLNVQDRQATGKLNNRRLRLAGSVPAVLYGHGAESISLAIGSDEFVTKIRQGIKMVDLKGAVSESALISDIQWDTFGKEVLHVDLIRVSKDERIEVTVALETRGMAPGVSEGGTVEVPLHELTLECPAGNIPEKLEININELKLNDILTASSIELPAGAKLVTDGDTVVVQCIEIEESDDDEAGAAASAEPEVIGKSADDEADASE